MLMYSNVPSPAIHPSLLLSLTLPASFLCSPPLPSSLPFFPLSLFLQVIEWSTHHKDDPPPPEDDENKEKRTDDIEPWDQEFLKVDQGTLFELILVCKVLREFSTGSKHNILYCPPIFVVYSTNAPLVMYVASFPGGLGMRL